MDDRHVPLTVDAEGKVTGVGETALTRAIRESRERESRATRAPWIEGHLRYGDTKQRAFSVVGYIPPPIHPGRKSLGQCALIPVFREPSKTPPEDWQANKEFVIHARTWEPRFRRMVERVLEYCESNPRFDLLRSDLEAIAREGEGVGRG